MRQVEKDIITVVRLVRLHPTALIDSLRNYSYREIQDAVSALIYDGRLILSSDRYLEVPS